jgi:hypothetical protein
MSTSGIHFEPLARDVQVDDDFVQVILADGREIRAPLVWFPRLHTATDAQRNRWELIGGGIGIHWPDVDEDISIEALLRRQ